MASLWSVTDSQMLYDILLVELVINVLCTMNHSISAQKLAIDF